MPLFECPKETAHRLGVSDRTVRRMVRDGELEHVRVRRCIRIPRGALPRPPQPGGLATVSPAM